MYDKSDTHCYESLKWAVEFRNFQASVRRVSLCVMVFMGIVVACVVGVLLTDPASRRETALWAAAVAGIALLAMAIWQYLRPARWVAVLESILGVAIGAIMVIGTFQMNRGGMESGELFACGLGMGLVGAMGAKLGNTIRRLSKLPPGKPDVESLRWVNQYIKEAKRSSPTGSSFVISLKIDESKYKVLLVGELVLLLETLKDDAQLFEGGEFAIEELKRGSSTRRVNVSVNLAGMQRKGLISRDDLTTYKHWSAS